MKARRRKNKLSEYCVVCVKGSPKALDSPVRACSFRDVRTRVCMVRPDLIGKDIVILKRGKHSKRCHSYGTYATAWRGRLGW